MDIKKLAPGLLLFLLGFFKTSPALATDPWPGETWQESTLLTGLDADFQVNLSGAHWNEVTQTLWVCTNGPGRFWALAPNAQGGFEVDIAAGRRGEWNAPGDLEAITQVDLEEPSVYVISENENTIRKYDVSTYGAAVLQRSWNLTPHLPAYDGSSGPEGLAFVPDEWLSLNGFVDANGQPYVSQNGMGGLLLVAHQKGGGVYAFDLDPDSNYYDFVGRYATSRAESSGLEFDRSSGKLYIWHNTGSNYIEVTDLTSSVVNGQRYFTGLKEYFGPKGGNLEGIAFTPADSDNRWFFMTDDSNQNGAALMWFDSFEPQVLGHDRYTTHQGVALQEDFPGLLHNDLGVQDLILTQEPAHGTLDNLLAGDDFDGSFVYRPDAGYSGTDQFTYESADGTVHAKVEITVKPLRTLTRAIASSFDDVEERGDGTMYTNSTDLELIKDGTNQTVGLRFNALDLPPGATVVNAHIQFTTDEATSEMTNLILQGEASADAPAFNLNARNLSQRVKTAAQVPWNPETWAVLNEGGARQKTPNLAPIIEEILLTPGWQPGNDLVLIISGQGKRVARAYDYSPMMAARLVIDYIDDSEQPTPPDETALIDVRVSAGLDDAEEQPNGSVNTSSTDLELVTDTAVQTAVGMRFNGVNIPAGAEITRAFIQFATDEASQADTDLTFHGEDRSNPPAFSANAFDISRRARTDAGVLWEPAAWNLVDEIGLNQQSPDLSAIVQEIVDRPDWQSGHALAFIVTGTGKRVAESFEGRPGAAPLLHVEFIP